MNQTNRRQAREVLLFTLLVGFLIPLEVLCAQLAYETIGEVTRVLYYLAIGLNLLFILLALRSRALAALGIGLLALVIIPYQLFLGHRLLQVNDEARRIVTYVYEERIETGEYPSTLADYEYHNPEMAQFIQRYQVEQGGAEFSLFYRVGTENTSHHYMSRGGWGYYPD